MAKYLREIAKKDVGTQKEPKATYGGENTSEKGELNIDNLNAASGNRDFAAKHKTQKWADRNGNDDGVFKGKKEAPYMKQKDSVYEAKGMKCESCGSIYEGESCGCGKSVPEAKPGKKGMLVDKSVKEEIEQIDELSRDTLNNYVRKSHDQTLNVDANGLSYKAGIPSYYRGQNKDLGKDPAQKLKMRAAGQKLAIQKLNSEETTTNTLRSVLEGAKVDRMVKHIKASEKAAGKSEEKAENIAWATANKRGMLNNKNKKVEEQASPADTPMKLTYPSDEVGQVGRV